MTDYRIYIDVETGTWGDSNALVFMHDGYNDELAEASDSEVIDHGKSSGDTLEYLMQSEREQEHSGIVEFDGDLKESVTALYWAAETILEALATSDPSEPCKLCDTNYGFHANDCPIHELNIGTDAVAEWVK